MRRKRSWTDRQAENLGRIWLHLLGSVVFHFFVFHLLFFSFHVYCFHFVYVFLKFFIIIRNSKCKKIRGPSLVIRFFFNFWQTHTPPKLIFRVQKKKGWEIFLGSLLMAFRTEILHYLIFYHYLISIRTFYNYFYIGIKPYNLCLNFAFIYFFFLEFWIKLVLLSCSFEIRLSTDDF